MKFAHIIFSMKAFTVKITKKVYSPLSATGIESIVEYNLDYENAIKLLEMLLKKGWKVIPDSEMETVILYKVKEGE